LLDGLPLEIEISVDLSDFSHSQRTGTDEFDMDESDTYGTGAHLDAEAVAA